MILSILEEVFKLMNKEILPIDKEKLKRQHHIEDESIPAIPNSFSFA